MKGFRSPADFAAHSNWGTAGPYGICEHAKWLDGARIERLLGSDLNGSRVTLS
jgi:hypothetical protein